VFGRQAAALQERDADIPETAAPLQYLTTFGRMQADDLRHGFAVNTIIDGYKAGEPGTRMAILSTYLGHVDPANTYWYLSAAPELLGLAGDRLERHLGGDA
jgi:integrase/recombinase XerD